MAEKTDSQIVVDVGKWEWSELWKKEDWWAVWLGFFILLLGVIIYFPHSGDMKAKLTEIEGKYLADAEKTDKFKTTGLTPVKSDLVHAPYVAEFPMVLECKVIHSFDLGVHTQFVGQILDAKLDESVLDSDGVPDVTKI